MSSNKNKTNTEICDIIKQVAKEYTKEGIVGLAVVGATITALAIVSHIKKKNGPKNKAKYRQATIIGKTIEEVVLLRGCTDFEYFIRVKYRNNRVETIPVFDSEWKYHNIGDKIVVVSLSDKKCSRCRGCSGHKKNCGNCLGCAGGIEYGSSKRIESIDNTIDANDQDELNLFDSKFKALDDELENEFNTDMSMMYKNETNKDIDDSEECDKRNCLFCEYADKCNIRAHVDKAPMISDIFSDILDDEDSTDDVYQSFLDMTVDTDGGMVDGHNTNKDIEDVTDINDVKLDESSSVRELKHADELSFLKIIDDSEDNSRKSKEAPKVRELNSEDAEALFLEMLTGEEEVNVKKNFSDSDPKVKKLDNNAEDLFLKMLAEDEENNDTN